MKFKEGQKVRVNKNLKNIENFKRGYMDKMAELEGKRVTISRIDSDGDIMIKEDKNGYFWDERAFSLLNLTKQELLDMPIGTKIITNRDIFNIYIKVGKKDFCNNNADHIRYDEINDDLSLNTYLSNEDKIIKIEEPTYKTIYNYSAQVQEMTVAEIEKALGYAVKIIKEDK